MLPVGEKVVDGAALRNLSVKAMSLTLADATEQSDHGVMELPPLASLPELNTRILGQVAADVLCAYDTCGPIDIAHSWVLGAGLQDVEAMARGERLTDPFLIGINHRYWVRFTMELLFAARPGNEDTISRVFEPLLAWEMPVLWSACCCPDPRSGVEGIRTDGTRSAVFHGSCDPDD